MLTADGRIAVMSIPNTSGPHTSADPDAAGERRRAPPTTSRDTESDSQRLQKAIACIHDRREASLISRQHAVNLEDDEVHLLGQIDLGGEALNEFDATVESILLRDTRGRRCTTSFGSIA
jgi:hypothetical protein